MRRSLRPWDFFFSHSHSDLAVVSRLIELWQDLGIRIWHDGLKFDYTGVHSTLRILDGIFVSHFFALFYSHGALASKNVPQEFRSYLKRPVNFWGRREAGDVFIFTLPSSDQMPRQFLEDKKKSLLWWPSGGYQADLLYFDLPEDEASIVELGRRLVVVLDTFHLHAGEQVVSNDRRLNGRAYWDWARIETLSRWAPVMDMDAILRAFDGLRPPYDRWDCPLRASVADELAANVNQVARCQSKGVDAVALFCEAFVLATHPRISTYNHEGAKYVELFGVPGFHDFGLVGGLLDSLLSLGFEGNWVDDLQHAYYVAREQFTGAGRDALDLTVLFAIGFMIHRWEDQTIMPQELVRKLAHQERISGA